MSYIFQDGIIGWETDISTTSIKKSTDWIYSTKAKTVGGSAKTIKRVVERGVGLQPANGNYINDSYTIPNSFANNIMVFNINKYDNSDLPNKYNNSNLPPDSFDKIECKQGIWDNTDITINASTISNIFILNENTDSVNREIETPWLVAGGFSCNIPETATATSVQIKIERSSFSFNDAYLSGSSYFIPSVDCFLLDENITTYSRDSIITLHNIYGDDEKSFDNNIFENKAEYFKAEKIDIETTGISYNNYSPVEMNNISKTLIDYEKPIGVWSKNRESVIYGNSVDDNWATDNDTLTSLVMGDFAVKLKIKQKIFKGYGYKTFYNFGLLKAYSVTDFLDNSQKKLNWGIWDNSKNSGIYGSWLSVIKITYPYKLIKTTSSEEHNSTESHYYHRNFINHFDISLPLASYILSRIYSISVKVFYEEPTDGFKTVYDTRAFVDNNNLLLKSNDIYFKNQKCFDGVCYNFINSLDDIYKKNKITGDGNCINNMYNEYNIIDKYSKNVYYADICYNENIDITIPHNIIDIKLVYGMKVLLYGQSDASENGVYIINDNYNLERYPMFIDNKTAHRAKIYVDYGTGKGKQFFLKTSTSNRFPLDNENKNFEEGKSYILKNVINYDIYNTSPKYLNKILFTDYSIPRTMLPDVDNLFYDIDLNGVNFASQLSIRYKDTIISYRILTNSPIISTITNSGIVTYGDGCDIFVSESSFYNNVLVGDYIKFIFYNGSSSNEKNQILVLCSKVKNKLSGYRLQVCDSISKYHIDYITSLPQWSYKIYNMNCVYRTTIVSDIISDFNNMPFGCVISATDISPSKIRLSSKKNNFKYLNYNDFEIIYNGGYINFTTSNQMSCYTLKSFLDNLLNNIGTSLLLSYIYNNMDLSRNEFTYIYTEVENNGKIIITPDDNYKYKLSFFKEYTFVDIYTGSGTMSYTTKSLVLSVTDNDITIELPKIDGLPITINYFSIYNINNIETISNILLNVYLNYTHSYYNKIDDSSRSLICETYMGILKNNSIIRNIISGIIYIENGEWNYDIYNFKPDSNYNNVFDTNMTYYPVEILELGIDNKTKLQKQLDISNFTSNIESFSILSGESKPTNSVPFNKSFINNSVCNTDSIYYLGGWTSDIAGSLFINEFYSVNVSGYVSDKALSIINTKDDLMINMKFLDITGNRRLYSKMITHNDDIYCVVGNINETSNSADYSFSLSAKLANNNGYSLLSTKSYNSYYKPKSCSVIYCFNSGGTYNNIELLSDFSGFHLALNDASANMSGLTICGSYFCDSSTSNGGIYNASFIKTHINKTIGTLMNFYNKNLIYGIDIVDSMFYKYFNTGNYTIIIGRYYNISSTKVYHRNTNNTIITSNITPILNNSLFILKIGNDGILSKIYFEKQLGYTNVSSVSKIVKDDEYFYFAFNNIITSYQKETIIVKYDFNGNKIWETNFKADNNFNYDVIICQDDNYIYVSDKYVSSLIINNILLDNPFGKAVYSYIIAIDKRDGGIINGMNLVSSEAIYITSVENNGSYLNVAGNYQGSILINNIPLNSISSEYFITKINKNNLI